MAIIKPFKAFRPSRDKVQLVASRSYISYSRKDLIRKLDENPFTFLHILNPEYKQKKTTRANSEARFKKVKDQFEAFVSDGILAQDESNGYYLYRQIKDNHSYTGLIAVAAVSDYEKGIIKKHEATIAKREMMFKNYLKATEINAEPVCFTYPNHAAIDQITAKYISQRAEYDFTTTDKVQHSCWLIQDENDIQTIEKSFSEIDSIYIADGHHRSASSALMGKEIAQKNKNHEGHELYNFFMGLFIPEKEMQIFAFHRLISDIGNYSSAAFIQKLQENFEVEAINKDLFEPRKLHEIGMYLEGKWYCLQAKQKILEKANLVESLDVSILSDHILNPILGITDLRTDERVRFVGGLSGVSVLKEAVDNNKAKIAFAHYPVSMKELKEISDAGFIMPPKSTWIEPKLRSGLTVYSTNEKHH